MKKDIILKIALRYPKGCWSAYSQLKNMLTEVLSEKEYKDFIAELSKILQM